MSSNNNLDRVVKTIKEGTSLCEICNYNGSSYVVIESPGHAYTPVDCAKMMQIYNFPLQGKDKKRFTVTIKDEIVFFKRFSKTLFCKGFEPISDELAHIEKDLRTKYLMIHNHERKAIEEFLKETESEKLERD